MFKRLAVIAMVALGVASGTEAFAFRYPASIFHRKYNKCESPEDIRLQRFWSDYYNALQKYYGALDRVDWVAYYKNHGYVMPQQCPDPTGRQRIHYYPVVVTPSMQWLIPSGTPCAPPCVGPCNGDPAMPDVTGN